MLPCLSWGQVRLWLKETMRGGPEGLWRTKLQYLCTCAHWAIGASWFLPWNSHNIDQIPLWSGTPPALGTQRCGRCCVCLGDCRTIWLVEFLIRGWHGRYSSLCTLLNLWTPGFQEVERNPDLSCWAGPVKPSQFIEPLWKENPNAACLCLQGKRIKWILQSALLFGFYPWPKWWMEWGREASAIASVLWECIWLRSPWVSWTA